MYHPSQQRMRYLIEFTLEGEVPKEVPLSQGDAVQPYGKKTGDKYQVELGRWAIGSFASTIIA